MQGSPSSLSRKTATCDGQSRCIERRLALRVRGSLPARDEAPGHRLQFADGIAHGRAAVVNSSVRHAVLVAAATRSSTARPTCSSSASRPHEDRLDLCRARRGLVDVTPAVGNTRTRALGTLPAKWRWITTTVGACQGPSAMVASLAGVDLSTSLPAGVKPAGPNLCSSFYSRRKRKHPPAATPTERLNGQQAQLVRLLLIKQPRLAFWTALQFQRPERSTMSPYGRSGSTPRWNWTAGWVPCRPSILSV